MIRLSVLFALLTLVGSRMTEVRQQKEEKDLQEPYPQNPTDTPQPLMGDLKDVRFLLWTRSNMDDTDYYQLVPEDLENLIQSPIDPFLPTYVMYHGYAGYGETRWIREAKTELLKLYECNVISVDWQTMVEAPWYNQAVENVYRVANYTAGFIDWIHIHTGLHPSQIHISGHSLGAQTAGLTGKYVTVGKVDRITGLDPAGPAFYDQSPEHRIDKSDAKFVDIIHANSGSIPAGCIGLFEPVGHVDFYPNGGMHQPGCTTEEVGDISNWLDLFGGCSHDRVEDLWVESIRALGSDNLFTSWPCSDWDTYLAGGCPDCGQGCLHMGLRVERNLQGTYFLRTNATSPFALGDNQ